MKEQFITLLESTNRAGIPELLKYLEQVKFYESAASTKFHGNYEGGLLDHSMNLCVLFSKKIDEFGLDLPKESRIICSLLHDLCKAGLYKKVDFRTFAFNSEVGSQGHGKLSIKRIGNFITLTPTEEEIIRYHMGPYHSYEASDYGEYDLRTLHMIYNRNKLAKLFYFCDDMASQFLDVTR